MKTVTEHLLALADAGNAAFTARLAPGVDPDRMLGCRIPQLRRLARTHNPQNKSVRVQKNEKVRFGGN